MKILIISDAWFPQINGVVRTLNTVKGELEQLGHQVQVLSPADFRSVPCPTYREIRLAVARPGTLGRRIRQFDPDCIHLPTEGPLGWGARHWCLRWRVPFTTSYHTRFPEYVGARLHLPPEWFYPLFRRFHAPSAGVMVATPSLRRELETRGFHNLRAWSRGVNLELFRPLPPAEVRDARPIAVYVGRVAVEKNIEAFLRLDLPGTKWVVGDGPQLAELRARYPHVVFHGARQGDDLVRLYAAADVFVFPSRTDTFGLVMLEAMACGVPVAAYPVTGPVDVVGDSGCGVLNEDLGRAAREALTIPRERCRAHAEQFTWRACAERFLSYLCPIPRQAG